MKRSKADKVHNSLLNSFKRQNNCKGVESFHNNFQPEESIIEMTQRTVKEISVSSPLSISLMPYTVKEFSDSFKSMHSHLQNISPVPTSGLKDLSTIVFAYIYLDLVQAGRSEDASIFYNCHSSLELVSLEKSFVVALKDIKSWNDIQTSPVFSKMYCNYIEIKISNKEERHLRKFISKQKTSVILRMFGKLKILNEKEQISFDNSLKSIVPKPKKTNCATPKSMSPAPVESREPGGLTITSPSITVSLNQSPVKNDHISTPKMTLSLAQEISDRLYKFQPNSSTVQICLFKHESHLESMSAAALSHNQSLLSTGFESSCIKLWKIDLDNDQIKKEKTVETNVYPDKNFIDVSTVSFFGNSYMNTKKENFNNRCHKLQGHSGPIYSTCFTHDDQYLLSASQDTTVRLWSTNDYLNKVVYQGHNWPVSCVETSSESFYFASGSFDSTVKLWSFNRTFPLRTFIGHKSPVNCVSFHSNVSYLCSSGANTRVWDINTGKCVRLFSSHKDEVLCNKFSNNGKLIATSSADGGVIVWDLGTNRKIKEINSHLHPVYSIDFSSDDSMLVTSSSSGEFSVFDLNCNSPNDADHVIINNYPLTENRILLSNFLKNNIVYVVETT